MASGFTVQPDTLQTVSSAAVSTGRTLAGISPAVSGVSIPADAFGDVTHSSLVHGLVDAFRVDKAALLTEIATDFTDTGDKLSRAADAYESNDEHAADRFLKLPELPVI
jgi:hypothetical protein